MGSGGGGTEEELTAQETALYDRQIRVWGVDAQKRCAPPLPRTQLCSCYFFFLYFFYCIIFVLLLVFCVEKSLFGLAIFQTEIQPFASSQTQPSAMTMDFPLIMWTWFYAFRTNFQTCFFFLLIFFALFRLFVKSVFYWFLLPSVTLFGCIHHFNWLLYVLLGTG